MSHLAVYRDFKPLATFRSLFRRKISKIYDANLHHGDVRPFACPIEVCCEPKPAQELYPLRECECLQFDSQVDATGGFCQDHHFWVKDGRLRESTTAQICKGESCFAGLPIPLPPHAEGSCTECSDKKTPPKRKELFDPTPKDKCGMQGEVYKSKTEKEFDCPVDKLDPETSIYETPCTEKGCDAVEVFYKITYVKRTPSGDEEGAPSDISNGVVIDGYIPNAAVTWGDVPAEWCIDRIRIYRTESTFEDGTTQMPTNGSEWLLVKEVPANKRTIIDDVPTECLGAPLTTYDPTLFPAPEGICHVVRTEDGIAVADKNRVYISYSGKALFTWDGIVDVDDKILALEAIGNTLFVITDNYPVQIKYRITEGVLDISRQTIRRRLPLKSHKSVSVYGNIVYFASTYSLMAWDIQGYGSDIKDALRALITPEQWRNIKPETVRGTAYEYGYMMAADGIPYALMLEFEGGGADTINKTSVMPITYAKADVYATDKGGIIYYKKANRIYKWDWRRNICDNHFELMNNNKGSLCLCCPWSVELFYDNEGKNRFDVMRVEFDEETDAKGIKVEFFRKPFHARNYESDGIYSVISSKGFRVKGYRSSQSVSVKLSSCAVMHEVRFATSFQELVASGGNQNELVT